jgi:hypothetical protein
MFFFVVVVAGTQKLNNVTFCKIYVQPRVVCRHNTNMVNFVYKSFWSFQVYWWKYSTVPATRLKWHTIFFFCLINLSSAQRKSFWHDLIYVMNFLSSSCWLLLFHRQRQTNWIHSVQGWLIHQNVYERHQFILSN